MKNQSSAGCYFVIFICLFSLHAVSAESPASPPPPKNKSEKNQVLDFEDEIVEGSSAKPDLFYLFQKKNFNYKRLIKMRDNFLPEMKRTSEDLQRVRSKN